MYTLRIFNKANEINRSQIYLGQEYSVRGVSKEDKKIGIKLRVFSSCSDVVPNDGIAIYLDNNAFIMTENGRTFETLNRPSDC